MKMIVFSIEILFEGIFFEILNVSDMTIYLVKRV